MKRIRVPLKDGIGSRILKIGYSLALAKKLGREPEFLWVQNPNCGTSTRMEDFFQSDLSSTVNSSAKEKSDAAALEEAFGERMITVRGRTPERLSLAELKNYELINLSSAVRKKIGAVEEVQELKKMAESELQGLRLAKELSDEIEQFAEKKFNGKVLGVHVRGGDIRSHAENNGILPKSKIRQAARYVPVERFVDKLKKLQNDYDTIFVSAEDEDHLETIKEVCKDKIIYRSKPYGRESLEHIQEALIEIYLLSKCDFLLCGRSKFSKLAVNLGEVPFESLK